MGGGAIMFLTFFFHGQKQTVLWNWDKFAIPLSSLSLSVKRTVRQSGKKNVEGGKTAVGLKLRKYRSEAQ